MIEGLTSLSASQLIEEKPKYWTIKALKCRKIQEGIFFRKKILIDNTIACRCTETIKTSKKHVSSANFACSSQLIRTRAVKGSSPKLTRGKQTSVRTRTWHLFSSCPSSMPSDKWSNVWLHSAVNWQNFSNTFVLQIQQDHCTEEHKMIQASIKRNYLISWYAIINDGW